jgi:hypothetical protein
MGESREIEDSSSMMLSIMVALFFSWSSQKQTSLNPIPIFKKISAPEWAPKSTVHFARL